MPIATAWAGTTDVSPPPFRHPRAVCSASSPARDGSFLEFGQKPRKKGSSRIFGEASEHDHLHLMRESTVRAVASFPDQSGTVRLGECPPARMRPAARMSAA